RESAAYRAGIEAVCADTPWGRMGLSICYDLRFPHLYQKLADMGADILLVPAAFTHVTGKDHWHVLNRARAIETGCFVIACCQCGHHADGRHTYGHSLVVNPWGKIVAEADEQPKLLQASLDLREIARVRGMIPSVQNRSDIL
ncbi:MAG: nitrilase-related carbon-nitrogen hydrolase, partial [Pseudomonadota bacterium]